jgi:chromosome partitioning protein
VGQTIACANQKGGVGKTTTVVNLGTYLALAGRRVLIVDVDPQGNATSGLGTMSDRLGPTLYEPLVDGAPLSEATIQTAINGLALVPSSVELAGAEVELAAAPQRERRLRRVIADARDEYDFVLLDCPPSLGLLTVNALTAADSVLIPLQAEYYALEGLTQLIATVNLVRDHLNPGLEIVGVVLTMYDSRTNLSLDVATEARRHLGSAVFDTIIPRNVRLSEAPSFGKPIAEYAPESRGAAAYAALAAELLERGVRGGLTPRTPGSDAAVPLRGNGPAEGAFHEQEPAGVLS